MKPEKEKDYDYYSKSNDGIISVKVLSDKPDDKGLVEVQSGENKFKVDAGALIDKTEK